MAFLSFLSLLSLAFYRSIFWITTPFWRFFLRRRVRRNKEDQTRWRERMGKTSSQWKKGGSKKAGVSLVWINAVSVGEALAVLPLISRLPEICGDQVSVLLTTGTHSAAQLVGTKLPAHAFHQYTPLDHPLYVRRFLSRWQPDMAIWVESELWPNLITQTGGQHIPMALINARLSAKSLKRWLRQKGLARLLMSHFDLCLAQNEMTQKGLIALGAKNVRLSGNLKYDAPPLNADEVELDAWRKKLESRTVFLAASTHRGEEEIIAQAHLDARARGHRMMTIIAPRHPPRAAEVAEKMRARGLTVICRSENACPENFPDIYIVDRLGEMGLFYRLASIVFMGGSLIERGGQNPLEPARLDCALMSGEHIFNFSDIYQLLLQAKCVEMVDPQTFGSRLSYLLDNEALLHAMKSSAKATAESLTGVLEQTLVHLTPLAKKLSERK